MSKRANKNTNNQAEDEDDGEIPQEYLRNTQDKGERLRIRTGYRTLIEDLNSSCYMKFLKSIWKKHVFSMYHYTNPWLF